MQANRRDAPQQSRRDAFRHVRLSAGLGLTFVASPEHIAGEHGLDFVDAQLLVELPLKRRWCARNPDLQFGIQVKRSAVSMLKWVMLLYGIE